MFVIVLSIWTELFLVEDMCVWSVPKKDMWMRKLSFYFNFPTPYGTRLILSSQLCLQDPIRVGFFWVMGFLAFLAQSIYKNGHRGIVMLASVGSLLVLFRKLKIAKLVNLVTFFLVVVGTIFYYLFFNFDYSYNNYWQYMRRSWSKMVSL